MSAINGALQLYTPSVMHFASYVHLLISCLERAVQNSSTAGFKLIIIVLQQSLTGETRVFPVDALSRWIDVQPGKLMLIKSW